MTYVLPNARPRKPFLAGVDPDLDKSGLAIYSRAERRFTVLQNLSFADMQQTILQYGSEQIDVAVEAGYLNKGFYRHHEKTLPKGFDKWAVEAKTGYMFKRGVDVGRNHAVGQLLVHILKTNGVNVIEWQPKIAKWNEADLLAFTGLKMRTNQEIRDAIRAAYCNL